MTETNEKTDDSKNEPVNVGSPRLPPNMTERSMERMQGFTNDVVEFVVSHCPECGKAATIKQTTERGHDVDETLTFECEGRCGCEWTEYRRLGQTLHKEVQN